MSFEFATATRIVFGPGRMKEAGSLARGLGGRALVVTGRNIERVQGLIGVFAEAGIATSVFSVSGEPEVGTVERGVAQARSQSCEVIVSFGGGSVIDAGKAIAAMLTNEGELLDYLEVIGRGKALTRAPAPFIAIPTTAGTGSEVTRNAVLGSPEHHVKVSLRSALMLPRVALVDPLLTHSLPRTVTASTGLDALTQLIEPYVSSRANPMTDAVCREGIQRAARSLRRVCMDPGNVAAREDMSVASLFGGLALANAGLGAVHGFAGPIGGMYPAPHGAVCAALLPHVMRANLRALHERQPKSETLDRYRQVARLLTSQAEAGPDAGADWVGQLVCDLGIPSLGAYGIQAGHISQIVEKAARASSMKANPLVLTPPELESILQAAL